MLQYLIIQLSLYHLFIASYWSLNIREVNNKLKISGRGRLREVVAYKKSVIATGGSTLV